LIQENEYYPLGAVKPRRSSARIVVATLRDLDSDKDNGSFRRDLYYRLQTHRVHIPPLRERREDLPLLVEHFLAAAAKDLGKKKPTAPRELIDLLNTFTFPGNVRELEALVFDAVAKHQGKVLS